MNKIYIICYVQGQYDNYQMKNIEAFCNEIDARASCEKKNKHEQYLFDISKKLEEHMIEWAKTNKEPDFPRYTTDDIDVFNEWDIWDNLRYSEMKSFVNKLDINEEDKERLNKGFFEKRNYYIEEIELK